MNSAVAAIAAVVLAATPVGAWSERTRMTVTVKAGDTLSSIAADSPLPWERWAFVNDLTNPHMLHPGDVLLVPRRDGRRYVPPRPTPRVSRSVGTSAPSSNTTGGSVGSSSNPYVDPSCEAAHSQQWSPSGTYWGKYQFDRQTWAAHGGSAGTYGSASETEQDRVAARVRYDAWPNC